MKQARFIKQQGLIDDETTHDIIIGDAVDVLSDEKMIRDESIQSIVTSPPYGLYKDYGGKFKDRFDLEGWTGLIDKIAVQGLRVLRKNGSFLLNVSPIPIPGPTKEIMPLDSHAYFIFKKHGYYLRNKIAWTFHNMQNCVNRLSGRWEAILWFVKDIDNYVFNLDAVKVPFTTDSKKDNRLKGKSGRNPTDVWYFDRVNNVTKKKLGINHPCVFPEPMIKRIILMTTDEGDTVLDPFVGSGTTMKVARRLKRNSIGIEINPRYKKLIKRRIYNAPPMVEKRKERKKIKGQGKKLEKFL
jgi:adenine-specific DNA-methyltransferase